MAAIAPPTHWQQQREQAAGIGRKWKPRARALQKSEKRSIGLSGEILKYTGGRWLRNFNRSTKQYLDLSGRLRRQSDRDSMPASYMNCSKNEGAGLGSYLSHPPKTHLQAIGASRKLGTVRAGCRPSSRSHTFNVLSRNKSLGHAVLASCKGFSPLLRESGFRRKLNPVGEVCVS